MNLIERAARCPETRESIRIHREARRHLSKKAVIRISTTYFEEMLNLKHGLLIDGVEYDHMSDCLNVYIHGQQLEPVEEGHVSPYVYLEDVQRS